MRPEIVTGIKNWLSTRSPELQSLYISWFGGEPLLALDLILEINKHAQQLIGCHTLLFKSGITTNGWLLNKSCFHQLIGSGVTDYQITLDGPELTHDHTRRKANGFGTFAVIYDNLMIMRNSDQKFHVNLRLHLMPSNFEINKNFAVTLAEDFGADLRFDIFPHTVRNLGGPIIDRRDLFPGSQDKIVEQQITDIFYARAKRSKPSIHGEHTFICYAAKANSFLIRPDGRIGKCTVDLYNDRNTVGFLTEDGRIEIDNQKFSRWVRGLINADEHALSCPLSNIDAS